MAKVISGSAEELRRRPVFSLTVCTVAPLKQDKEGIEGALVLAEAGVPVGFLAMPTLGTTAPATLAGAYVVGDAEIISGIVLLQLAYPGAPVFHSMMHGWADPRSGNYISYSLDSGGRYVVVDMAHHWKIPCFGGAYGTDSPMAGSWQSAAEVALDPFLIGLAGAEFVTGMGLVDTYTLLYPESIILDADIYHRARYQLMHPDISSETLALDVIAAVGPGGHFLAQRHTRLHMRESLKPALVHDTGPDGKYRDAVEVARDKVKWILKEYQPEPLEDAQRKELTRIVSAADRELDGGRR
jgi:trimethylamine--corrinoid protein Co-methyltransferase